MEIEEALYSQLRNNVTMYGYVYNRIYPMIAPDNVSTPYVVYQVIHKDPVHTIKDDSDVAMAMIQVSVWADTYLTAKSVASTVKRVLADHEGLIGGLGGVTTQKIIYDGDSDIHDPVTGRFHIPIDFTICY